MNTLSAEQLAIVGLFIAALLEPVKLVPWITSRKFLPIAAIAIGIILAGTVLREEAMSLKEVFFSGIIIGLTAIGGRSASQAVTGVESLPAEPVSPTTPPTPE